ncbi:putative major sperm protein (MSP) [Helianthus annuus]|nr:putative major sperm protein (MSP) [Helianthus annuus]
MMGFGDADEPGKQVRSAVRIKNHSSSHVAFKFQTTAPKSCYMRPPGGVLAPGESLIATVFKFVEQPDKNEKQLDQRSKVKFKIMSLKVKEGTDFVPELFDEQKDEVVVERILRVIFLNADRPTPALEKLKHQLAEAEAELELRLRRKPQVDTGPKVVGQGLVIDEWKERREKYLARQQVEAVDLM